MISDFFVGVVDLGFHPIFDHIAGLKIQEERRCFHLWYIYTCFAYTLILVSSSFKKKYEIFGFSAAILNGCKGISLFDPTPSTAGFRHHFCRTLWSSSCETIEL